MTKNNIKFALISLLSLSSIQALEFNEVGHKALGMGGIGVAIRNNPYAVFYNPALSASEPLYRVGYGLSFEASEKNLLKALDYDLANITMNTRNDINALLSDNMIRAKAQGAASFQIPDIFGFGTASIGYAQSINLAGAFYGYIPESITDIDNADASFGIRRVDMQELPLAYAFPIQNTLGNFNFGASVKFLKLSNDQVRRSIRSSDSSSDIQDDLKNLAKGSSAKDDYNFGIDAGFTFSPKNFENFTLGIVGKNLNNPKFKFSNGKLTLHPQARMGLSYTFSEHFSIGTDLDLTKNALLLPNIKNIPKQYSQKLGFGVEASGTYFSARAGIADDLKQDSGAILSLGLGFGFLDLSASVATKTQEIENTKYPRHFSLQLGGGFTF
ncbi:hypothetical protein DMB92_06715 [Campylobacter sp. MIT 99-7217]|uniref:conjugal transfer protein TraF n=1 Tax=Campylobacter sp. MIT 99-7217 TaxID=535091 RepID=UPI0011589E48|nr:conjugal transfer protein TraF [Campylobacter sp. MIT 99-7217]TQR31376.1 hypothetical protein DMB92_06715 [Campylobacter sp. MIT 99-7217]